jgi:methylated-DNA-[protein]-cysteine S-methyltransferase
VAVTRHRYVVEGWGVGELWTEAGVVLEHSFDARAVTAGEPLGTPASPESSLAEQPARVDDDFVPDLVERVHRQLAGEQVDFHDVQIELGWCTQFQRAAVEALRGIPWGEVVTYGELAVLAGRPGAARAAGSVCAGNRFAFIVPCHRVVAASGIGGYGTSGTALKRRLLELEGVPVAAL